MIYFNLKKNLHDKKCRNHKTEQEVYLLKNNGDAWYFFIRIESKNVYVKLQITIHYSLLYTHVFDHTISLKDIAGKQVFY